MFCSNLELQTRTCHVSAIYQKALDTLTTYRYWLRSLDKLCGRIDVVMVVVMVRVMRREVVMRRGVRGRGGVQHGRWHRVHHRDLLQRARSREMLHAAAGQLHSTSGQRPRGLCGGAHRHVRTGTDGRMVRCSTDRHRVRADSHRRGNWHLHKRDRINIRLFWSSGFAIITNKINLKLLSFWCRICYEASTTCDFGYFHLVHFMFSWKSFACWFLTSWGTYIFIMHSYIIILYHKTQKKINQVHDYPIMTLKIGQEHISRFLCNVSLAE